MSSPAPFASTDAGDLTETPAASGSRRRRARWGADGRRIRRHDTAGCGGSAVSAGCRRSCGLCQGSGKGKIGAAGARTEKFNKANRKRAAICTRQYAEEAGGGRSSSSGSASAAILGSSAKFEAGSEGKEAWPENSTNIQDRRSRSLEEHYGAGKSGDCSCWEASIAATRNENTSNEDHDRRVSCVSGPLPNPSREKAPERRREIGWREEVDAMVAKYVAEELHGIGQQLENDKVPEKQKSRVSETAACNTRTRVDRPRFSTAPPPDVVRARVEG